MFATHSGIGVKCQRPIAVALATSCKDLLDEGHDTYVDAAQRINAWAMVVKLLPFCHLNSLHGLLAARKPYNLAIDWTFLLTRGFKLSSQTEANNKR